MAVSRRVKTVHRVGEGNWRCAGIATWSPDPLLDEAYGREEYSWWCDCTWRERHDEI